MSSEKQGGNMLKFLKQEANLTKTTNGDIAYKSTLDHVLDLFSNAASMRHKDETTIQNFFDRAYLQDKELALKCLFYIRDVREGLGERRVFRVILNHLLKSKNAQNIEKLLSFVPEYGRWDDILVAIDTPAQETMSKIIKNRMKKDIKALREDKLNEISLMAKWLPKEDTASTRREAKKLIKLLKLPDKKYRHNLTELRKALKIVERNLSQKDYTFKYENLPSLAMMKYKKAFIRNDETRYKKYLEAVKENKKKINTKVLAPYQITRVINNQPLDETEKNYLDTAWNNLPDYAGSSNALAVVDVSGSMNGEPANVAQALGIYFAEHNKGLFHNHFIIFSKNPRLIEIKGDNIVEKVQYINSFNDWSNTDIEKTYMLLLNTALKHNLPQNEMPEKLYIISDMQFDRSTDNSDISVFHAMKKKYQENGYKLPDIIFWNVGTRCTTFPVTKNDQGVISVSGFNTNLFKMVEENNFNYNPYDFMMKTLKSERYKAIKITA